MPEAEQVPVAGEQVATPEGHEARVERFQEQERAGFSTWVADRPWLQRATQAAVLFTALAQPARSGVEAVKPTAVSETAVEAFEQDAHGVPIGVGTLIERSLESGEAEEVKTSIGLLRTCPECIPDEEVRARYALELFQSLNPHDRLTMSYHLEIITDEEVRSKLVFDAVREVGQDPHEYALLAATYEKYAPYLSESQWRALLIFHLSARPVLLAHTLAQHEGVRAVLRDIDGHMLGRANEAVSEEALIAGSFEDLNTTYGTNVALSIVAANDRHKPGTLYRMMPELEQYIDTDSLEHLTHTPALGTDPYALLALHHEAMHEEGVALGSRESELLQNIVYGINGYPYPQITLRDAHKIREQLGVRADWIDTMIQIGMEKCVENRNYRALLDYYETYRSAVHDPAVLEEPLAYGATEAYQAGDFESFLSFYDKLPVTKQEVLQEEHEFAVRDDALSSTQPEINAESKEMFDRSFNPSTRFTPDHLPFPEQDMRWFVARLIQDSMNTTSALVGNDRGFHGLNVRTFYGQSFISTPIEDFYSILLSDQFGRALRDTSLELSYVNVFMLAESVYGNLRRRGAQPNGSNIESTAREVLTHLESAAELPLFGPGVRTIFAAHEESNFSIDSLKRIHQLAGGFPDDLLFGEKGMSLNASGENEVKKGLLEAIRNAHDGPVTIVLSGHGSPENWAFAENLPNALVRTLNQDPRTLSYQELGDAIIQANNPEIRLVIAACLTYDYLDNLHTYLAEHNVAAPPIVSIAEANRQKYGFAHKNEPQRSDVYQASFMLNAMMDNMLEDSTTQGVRLKHMLRAQGNIVPMGAVRIFLRKQDKPTGTTQQGKPGGDTPSVIEVTMHHTPSASNAVHATA